MSSRRTFSYPLSIPALGAMVLGVALYLAGQGSPTRAEGPAAAPAGHPAGVDLSSPKAAAKSLYHAVEAEDASALRQVMQADTPDERRLVDAFADLILAGRKLRDAAKAKWGGAGEEMGATMVGKDQLEAIDAGVVKAEGEEATLTVAGRPTKYRRAGGQWRVVVTDYAHAKPAELPKQVELLRQMAGVMTSTAAEIAAGKFATSQEAESAIVNKYHRILIAASQPPMPPGRQSRPATPVTPGVPATRSTPAEPPRP